MTELIEIKQICLLSSQGLTEQKYRINHNVDPIYSKVNYSVDSLNLIFATDGRIHMGFLALSLERKN